MIFYYYLKLRLSAFLNSSTGLAFNSWQRPEARAGWLKVPYNVSIVPSAFRTFVCLEQVTQRKIALSIVEN